MAYSQAFKSSGGGNIDILNSEEKEFYCNSGTIEKNKFLQYVETRTLKNSINQLNDAIISNWISEDLEDNKFLLYYTTSDNNVYASIYKSDENNNISLIYTLNVASNSNSSYFTGMVKLDNNRFLCTFYFDKAVILTVENDVITAGTVTRLSTDQNMSIYVHMAVVHSNIVVLPYFGNNLNGYYNKSGVVTMKVDGTTITQTDRQELGALFPYPYQGNDNIQCVQLTDSKVCVVTGALSNDSNKTPEMRGTVIDVDSSGVMTINTTNKFMGNNGYTGMTVKPLDSSHFILAWTVNTSVVQICVMTVNSDNTLTLGTRLSLSGTGYWAYDNLLYKYDSNTYILATRSTNDSNAIFYCYVLNMSSDNVFTQLSRSSLDLDTSSNAQYDITIVKGSMPGFFIEMGYQNSIGLWYQSFTLDSKIICKEYVDTVYGISTSSATTTKPGKVLIPTV